MSVNDLKVGLRSALISDMDLVTLLGGEKVKYRGPITANTDVPLVTYFIMNTSPNPDDPMEETWFQVDVWSKSGDLNDEISSRIRFLLDKKSINVVGRIVFLVQLVDEVELYEDEEALQHDVLQFRVVHVKAA